MPRKEPELPSTQKILGSAECHADMSSSTVERYGEYNTAEHPSTVSPAITCSRKGGLKLSHKMKRSAAFLLYCWPGLLPLCRLGRPVCLVCEDFQREFHQLQYYGKTLCSYQHNSHVINGVHPYSG